MHYSGVTPPTKNLEFSTYSKEDARRFFEWYVSQIEKRIQVLSYNISIDLQKEGLLDFSPESLITVWTWMENKMKCRPKTSSEMEEEIRDKPSWLQQIIIENHIATFTDDTLDIAWDVSVYFGEMFVRNFSSLYWSYNQNKKAYSYSHPIVKGFTKKLELDPALLVTNCLRLSAQKNDPQRLLDKYLYWSQYVSIR